MWLARRRDGAGRTVRASTRVTFLPEIGLSRARREVHGVYLPELPLDVAAEAVRLRRVMDELGCVNLFVSEGAGVFEYRA